MKNIPNILSGLRILMVGAFVYLFISKEYAWSLIVFATAFFTDVLDGYLARKFHWITDLGKLLDPVADKLLVLSALVCILIAKSAETFYLVIFILVLVKESLMLAGGMMMLKNKTVAYSDWYGKTATGLFALGIVLTLLDIALTKVNLSVWAVSFLAIAVALSYYAMMHYAMTQMFAKPKGETESITASEEPDTNQNNE